MIREYVDLVADVDRIAERIATRYRKHLVCAAGCSACCRHHLSVFKIEAAAVREAVRSLQRETRETLVLQAQEALSGTVRGDSPACPLLIRRRCSIYVSRPIICRTQGLPLLIERDDGVQQVDFCPLNFSVPGATNDLEEDQLVVLEKINQRLVRANLRHCAESGMDRRAAGTRKLMGAVILDQL
jgi:Fe-S-cluster containining protein